MKLKIFQVDAFSNIQFKGNPAAVVPLKNWLADELLQNIALENNLSETAFFVPNGEGFELRWFTPTTEVNLCGHATLATAHVLFKHFKYDQSEVLFKSKSGNLKVSKGEDGYKMIFPVDTIKPVTTPVEVLKALKIDPVASFTGRDDYLIIVDTQRTIEQLNPDFKTLATLEDCRGVIVSAPGNDVDFVSRCFYPQSGVDEDPATGSAHTTLTPYWAKKLNKTNLTALQLSKRQGEFNCELKNDKVIINGHAKTFMKGKIFIEQSK